MIKLCAKTMRRIVSFKIYAEWNIVESWNIIHEEVKPAVLRECLGPTVTNVVSKKRGGV